jgi:hypothetical protein
MTATRVLTVLDRQVLVQDAENPCVGMIPFMAYRPTPLQKQMVGIGELEPIEHLQRELDTLRSQRSRRGDDRVVRGLRVRRRRDRGGGSGVRAGGGDPGDERRAADAIMPLQVRDVPGRRSRRSRSIRQDIDAVTGVTRWTTRRAGASTATEAQLVQASLSKRIELKSRRFEIEVVRHAARCSCT